MQTVNTLLLGAVLGSAFVHGAYAVPRLTRQLLAAVLLVAALVYVAFLLYAGMRPGWLLIELLGVVLYGTLGLRGLRGSRWWLAGGWALHPVWDVALHLVGPGHGFTPRGYALACLAFDLVVAGVIMYRGLRAPEAAPGPALPH